MVRTPRWIASYKNKVAELLAEGKTYIEIGEILEISDTKALMCEMSSNNYHVSYDTQPEDWVSPEFVYEFDEAKATLYSEGLSGEIKSLTDPEMAIMMKYVDEVEMTSEEREWASEKFFELQRIAYGNDTSFQD
jgi:hypothetical protein